MKELIELINSRFIERTADLQLQKNVWEATAGYFRPDISLYRNVRPSVVIARETGDLGLSVLWIVETALARPILKDITLNINNSAGIAPVVSCINDKTLVALAHSESPEAPVTYIRSDDKAILNGTKKYITAGRNADLLMVTCRTPGAQKPDGIAFIRKNSVPAGSLVPLNLKIMQTVDHASFIMEELAIDSVQVPECDPAALRRSVKKWGIIERALIMESYIGFLVYCNHLLRDINVTIASDDELISMLEKQSESASKQIDEAVYEKMITTENAGTGEIIKITGRFRKAYTEKEQEIPDEYKIRLADLFLFNNLK